MTDNDGTQERAAQTMPEGLRERSVKGLTGYGSCIAAEDARVIVDAIYGDIEQAGYVLVKADRWERVLFTAREGLACINERDGAVMVPFQAVHLKRGDLDAEAGA